MTSIAPRPQLNRLAAFLSDLGSWRQPDLGVNLRLAWWGARDAR